mgnify:CR=1 FL=1
MLLKTLVKVSAVNNLSDARYCAGMGVPLIGLPLDTNYPVHITPVQFKAITQWIQGISLVGELQHPDLATIQATLNNFQLAYLQVDHPIDPTLLASLDIPVLIRILWQGHENFEEQKKLLALYSPFATYFLIETIATNPATISKLQKQLEQLAVFFPIIQGFNITTTHISYLVDKTRIQGIGLQGGTEIKPGYKDFDDLATILALLTVA